MSDPDTAGFGLSYLAFETAKYNVLLLKKFQHNLSTFTHKVVLSSREYGYVKTSSFWPEDKGLGGCTIGGVSVVLPCYFVDAGDTLEYEYYLSNKECQGGSEMSTTKVNRILENWASTFTIKKFDPIDLDDAAKSYILNLLLSHYSKIWGLHHLDTSYQFTGNKIIMSLEDHEILTPYFNVF